MFCARLHRKGLLTVAAAWMAVLPMLGQTNTAQSGITPPNANVPAYEIVSIRSNKSGNQWNADEPPDGFSATNVSLQDLIGMAYGNIPLPLPDRQVVGAPNWFKSEKFDVNAKVDISNMDAMKKVNDEDDIAALARHIPTGRMLMLQGLLADRFKLKVHYETRELPVYALVVAKNGAKLKEPKANAGTNSGMGFGDRNIEAANLPISVLANLLSAKLERPVLDKTNLTGYYDYELKWTPYVRMNEPVEADTQPGLFTAIQEQLGLKLEPAKGPVQVLVIDHVERPSEN